MTDTRPPQSEQPALPPSHQPTSQTVETVQGQMIAQMVGGIAVGQLTIYQSQVQAPPQTDNESESSNDTSKPDPKQASTQTLGENPYQGLLAFHETDGDRFFGRNAQIQDLWDQFQRLHDAPSTIRLLTVYGPSGSGKSSLARAGLIPALGQKPLPGSDVARVVSMVPGSHPLEGLATVLARIATQDATPVAKTREFTQELLTPTAQGTFDGLRRIADSLPNISVSPLIVLVDQFEETYTLCGDPKQRDAFVANLLEAAGDRTQRVSVILTLRSDFLGNTQQHPELNKLVSDQGYLVPIMQPDELKVAIAEPAKRSGHELDPATVQLLVEQTRGHQGTLPLLQVALQRIWEGLEQGYKPLETLEKIGGVGGALADEAQRLYEDLNEAEKELAPRIFVALVQVNKPNEMVRRRAPKSELITSEEDAAKVDAIINRFAAPRVRFLVTSFDKEHGDVVEVAHEALLRNWDQLKEWIADCRVDLRQKHKIELAAEEWAKRRKFNGYLLQGRPLRDAKEFDKDHGTHPTTSLSHLATEFIRKSQIKQRNSRLKLLFLVTSPLTIISLTGTSLILDITIRDKVNSFLIKNDNCETDVGIRSMLQYMWWTGNAKALDGVNLCGEYLLGIRLPNSTIRNSNLDKSTLSEANLMQTTLVGSSFRGATIVSADFQGSFLMKTDFQCLDNQCTDLRNTNFQNSMLMEAQFQNAFLDGVNFENSDLRFANLYGAKNLSVQQLKSAKLCKTTLPREPVQN